MSEPTKVCVDVVSLTRIKKLHPRLRSEAVAILNECTLALTGRAMARFTYTLRTMSEQKDLYAQGRTASGNKVTNARAGQSYHNYGLAIDFALVIDDKEVSWNTKTDWDGDKKSDWMEVVAIFKKYGWEWGGSWTTFKDMPHFQKTFGYHWSTLMKMYQDKKLDASGFLLLS